MIIFIFVVFCFCVITIFSPLGSDSPEIAVKHSNCCLLPALALCPLSQASENSAMQAVPLAALNGSVMAAFKSPSLSPPSAELAQTLGKMGSNPVYEISATTSPVGHMESLSDMEDKCRLGEEVLNYTTQFYTTVESQSRASSPSTVMAASPKDSAGNLTPVSISSKDTSSSEALSALEDEGSDGDEVTHRNICIPMPSGDQGDSTGATQVKHWTYEDQFKQVRKYNLVVVM